jgi:hypothetical protein
MFHDEARGRLLPGMAGDVTILAADPHDNVRNFARVRYTIRGGGVLYVCAAAPARGGRSGRSMLLGALLAFVMAALAVSRIIRRHGAARRAAHGSDRTGSSGGGSAA